MPELPEVETVRRGLAPVMEARRILAVEQRRPDLRFPFPDDFTARLEGTRVLRLGRRAKYLLAELDSGETLIAHLGMSGSFRIEEQGRAAAPGLFHHPRGKAEKHDHVVFSLEGGAQITFNDPRRFGFMLLAPSAELEELPMFAVLGVEPLSNALNGSYLNSAFAGRATSLKAALMDQRVVAGLGNIYVCEALFRAGLSPRRRAGSIARKGAAGERLEALVNAIRSVIEEAVRAGGSSLRDYVHTDGTLGLFQHAFAVYDREGEPCVRPGCAARVRRIVQQGRSTFYCPACQR